MNEREPEVLHPLPVEAELTEADVRERYDALRGMFVTACQDIGELEAERDRIREATRALLSKIDEQKRYMGVVCKCTKRGACGLHFHVYRVADETHAALEATDETD